MELRAFDPTRPGERGFVLSTWVRSYAHYWHGKRRADRVERHAKLVQRVLQRARTVVACSSASPDALHGWACAEKGLALHYAYVPLGLRGHGLARALIAAALGSYGALIEVTHRWPFPSQRFHHDPFLVTEAA